MHRVSSSAGLLPEFIDMAFIDIGFLNGIKGFRVPDEGVEVVLYTMDISCDMCDRVIHAHWWDVRSGVCVK